MLSLRGLTANRLHRSTLTPEQGLGWRRLRKCYFPGTVFGNVKDRRHKARAAPGPTGEDASMSAMTRVLCLAALLLWSGCSFAEDFPNRPIHFIVPFPAGGPADVIG